MARAKSLSSPAIIFLVGGLAILAFSTYKAVSNYAMANFAVRDIGARIQKWLIDGVVLELTMNIRNDSPVPIPIDRFQGMLKWGNQVLAPINLINPVSIQSGQITSVPFAVPVSYAGLAENVVSLIQSKNFLSNLKVEGVLNAGGVNVPLTQNIVSFG